MKKIFLGIVLGCTCLSTNLYTMQAKKNNKEHIKAITSLTASAMLGYASATLPFYIKKLYERSETKNNWYFKPASLLMYPCYLLESALEGAFKRLFSRKNAEEFLNGTCYTLPYLIAGIGGLAACYLGRYGIKKYQALSKAQKFNN